MFIDKMKILNLVKRLNLKNALKVAGIITLNSIIGYAETKPIIQDTNKLKNAIVIIADPSADWNGAFKYVGEHIEKVRNAGYTVYVDTVSTKEEYFDTFRRGVDSLDGRFDFYLCNAHGVSERIELGIEIKVLKDDNDITIVNYTHRYLTSKDLQKRDLSNYFNLGARGIQYSCSVADTSIKNNFAQSLANSTGIPIEGCVDKIGGVGIGGILSDDLHLIAFLDTIIGFSALNGYMIKGFSSEDRGIIGSYTLVKKEGNKILEEGFKYDKEVSSPYFNNSELNFKVYHYGTPRSCVYEVKPQK
jgi:hypothetical protein